MAQEGKPPESGSATDRPTEERTQNQASPQAAVIHTLARETHDADLAPGEQSKIQLTFSYTDGFSREIQKKTQAEPGPVPKRDANVSSSRLTVLTSSYRVHSHTFGSISGRITG